MSIKKAIKRIANPADGFDASVTKAVVLSVDKNGLTCNVQTVTDGIELDNVKLKALVNSDLTQIGIVVFPAIGSFVLIGQVEDNNIDTFVISFTQIESITLDTATALKLLLSADGKINLNAVQMTFNSGKNGGIPLLKPLTASLLKLQQQYNALAAAFKAHVHPVVGMATGPTTTPSPAPITPLIKSTDIENKAIVQ